MRSHGRQRKSLKHKPLIALAVVAALLAVGVMAATGNLNLNFLNLNLVPPGSVSGTNFYVSTAASTVANVYGGASGSKIYGELFKPSSTLLGRQMDLITIPLIRPANAVGSIEVGVFNLSGNLKYSFCNIQASAIQMTKTDYTCHNPQSKYTLVANDVVGIKYSVGDYANRIGVHVDTTNPIDGINAHRTRMNFNGGWDSSTSQDITMRLGLASSTLGVLDPFGVKKIYTQQAGQTGREWYMNMNNPTSDGIFFTGQTQWTKATITKNPDGSWKVSGANYPVSYRYQVRMITSTPVGSEQWKNVEWTAYVKPIKTFGKQDWMPNELYNAIILYARGGTHSSQSPCDGTAMKAGVELRGATWFKKEVWHSGGYTDSSGVKQSVAPMLTNKDSNGHYSGGSKWIGIKVVMYNINNDANVKMEIWLDKNANNTWEKVNEFTDTGSWNANRSDFWDAGCKDKSGAIKQRNHVINYSGPWASIRTDGMELDFKWLSVREIDAPGGTLSPGTVQTTPYSFDLPPMFSFFTPEYYGDPE